ncbi:MAG: hypothetical protein Q8Q86_00695 [Candidatus Daviesbacteria bacterium]|nr:hypothetical protein [Candidatus Daviesbacteria bacterium]
MQNRSLRSLYFAQRAAVPAVGSPLAPARDIAQLRHILNFTWRENSPRKTSDMPRRVRRNFKEIFFIIFEYEKRERRYFALSQDFGLLAGIEPTLRDNTLSPF